MMVGGIQVAALGEDDESIPNRILRYFGEDPMLQLDRGEELASPQEHFGLAQEEVALLGQGVVEAGQDLGLCLRFEVHECVTRDQQIDPGDRRILQEVVAPKDDRTAQVAAEEEMIALGLEVFLPQGGRDFLQVLGGGSALARPGQRVVVDVGGINLGSLPVLHDAKRFAEQHGDAVGLFAGGDACAPDADRLERCLARNDPGEDFLLQVFPRLGISKVTGHVDEDGVEEGGEFVGVRLQVFDIIGIIFDADLRHPLGDPAYQRRPFVAAEVEATGVPNVLQKTRKVGTHRLLAPRTTPSATRVVSAEGISSSLRTKSAWPDLIAAAGIPKNSAESWSWAITVPPIFLMAPTPRDPSLPVPVRTTAIARAS